MDEIWKDIKGYEGMYQVSNLGNVRGLVFNNNQVTGKKKIHPIAKTDNGHGYHIVSLRTNGRRKNEYVHRIVAEAFCEKSDGKNFVNHLDFDRHNNRADNLEWCTHAENMQYSSLRLCVPKPISTPTKTGFKHIGFRNGRYRVHLSTKYGLGFDRTFADLKDAIAFRDECERKIYG